MRCDPLHGPRADAELLGDLPQTRAPRRSRCGADAAYSDGALDTDSKSRTRGHQRRRDRL